MPRKINADTEGITLVVSEDSTTRVVLSRHFATCLGMDCPGWLDSWWPNNPFRPGLKFQKSGVVVRGSTKDLLRIAEAAQLDADASIGQGVPSGDTRSLNAGAAKIRRAVKMATEQP